MIEVKIELTIDAFVEIVTWKKMYLKKHKNSLDVRSSDVVNALLMALRSKGALNVETQLELMEQAISLRRQKEGGAI